MTMMKHKSNLATIIEEYPIDYCKSLELAYGDGMMSEGGSKAIDELFENITLSPGQRLLDLGCGLGGWL